MHHTHVPAQRVHSMGLVPLGLVGPSAQPTETATASTIYYRPETPGF